MRDVSLADWRYSVFYRSNRQTKCNVREVGSEQATDSQSRLRVTCDVESERACGASCDPPFVGRCRDVGCPFFHLLVVWRCASGQMRNDYYRNRTSANK